jgi:diguanylate cyclase (GGDEF)-like protein
VRTLARAGVSSLVALCLGLSLVVVALTAIGLLGVNSSTTSGRDLSTDELATSTATGELTHDMDTAYADGERAFLANAPAQRAQLLGVVYTSVMPDTDTQLAVVLQLHAADLPAQHADIELFVRQWDVVRDILSPANVVAHPPAGLAFRLAAAYQPVSTHLGLMLRKEQNDALAEQATASAKAERTTWLLVSVAGAGLILGVLLLLHGIRRIRRALKPGEEQADFAVALQIAMDENEANRMLQRHLERTLPPTAAVVLNRNTSADRLESATQLPSGSPLAKTLRGAPSSSCLAVRSGRTHRENSERQALLSCPVCAAAPGASSCVPLVVGGEVIGSVLLSRPAPYDEADEQRIGQSVSQAAPVLANLRNLAIAERQAATDGLTGLPNKRAVTDALQRLFAQASTVRTPLALLLLDLDHFKQVNDLRGHQVGDQVLASVGAVLRTALRGLDFVGRTGGEEFVVLLPDTDIQAALNIAERVRAAIDEMTLPGSDVTVTGSIGVAVFPDHASTPDRLERLADAALYVAKQQGRNRVQLAEAKAADASVPGQREANTNPGPLQGTSVPEADHPNSPTPGERTVHPPSGPEGRLRALRPEARGKHQGARGGRDEHEQGEYVVVAGDQFQPTPGVLECPVVAPVRREKQQPARHQRGVSVVATLGASRQRPPAEQAHHQRGAEDPVAEAGWPVRSEDKCRQDVDVVVRPADRGHQQRGRGARDQSE